MGVVGGNAGLRWTFAEARRGIGKPEWRLMEGNYAVT